jgi:hypothetical protein
MAGVFNLQVDAHLREVSEFRRTARKSVQCASGALSESEYVEFVSVSIRPVFSSRVAARKFLYRGRRLEMLAKDFGSRHTAYVSGGKNLYGNDL